MLLAEAAAYYKQFGLTLWDQMMNIYEKYGYYKEGAASITMEGESGAEKIKQIMETLRSNEPQNFGKYKILKIRDYKTQNIKDCITNETTKIELPISNVLYYELENDAWCCARPSGTEPKIKFYMGVKGKTMEDADKQLAKLKRDMLALADK